MADSPLKRHDDNEGDQKEIDFSKLVKKGGGTSEAYDNAATSGKESPTDAGDLFRLRLVDVHGFYPPITLSSNIDNDLYSISNSNSSHYNGFYGFTIETAIRLVSLVERHRAAALVQINGLAAGASDSKGPSPAKKGGKRASASKSLRGPSTPQAASSASDSGLRWTRHDVSVAWLRACAEFNAGSTEGHEGTPRRATRTRTPGRQDAEEAPLYGVGTNYSGVTFLGRLTWLPPAFRLLHHAVSRLHVLVVTIPARRGPGGSSSREVKRRPRPSAGIPQVWIVTLGDNPVFINGWQVNNSVPDQEEVSGNIIVRIPPSSAADRDAEAKDTLNRVAPQELVVLLSTFESHRAEKSGHQRKFFISRLEEGDTLSLLEAETSAGPGGKESPACGGSSAAKRGREPMAGDLADDDDLGPDDLSPLSLRRARFDRASARRHRCVPLPCYRFLVEPGSSAPSTLQPLSTTPVRLCSSPTV